MAPLQRPPFALRARLEPHTQLALIAVSTRERRAARARVARELAAGLDHGALADYLRRQRLTLVVPARLAELGLADVASSLEPRLAATREHAVASAKAQWLLTDGVLRRLEGVGIAVLALKGVELSHRLYGDSASRESGDVDVLVAPQHLERAKAVIQQEFGYGAPVDALGSDGRPLLHYRLEHPNGWPSLELHWRVHWYEPASGAEMLRRSSMSGGRRRMTSVHELASLLLFYARDGFVGLRDVAAIAAWWDRYGSELPPGGLAAFARDFPQLAPALATSAAVAGDLVGLPRAPLGLDGRRVTIRERRAARLADPQPGQDISRLLADKALVDLLLAPTLDVKAFVRRQLLLDDSYNHGAAPGARAARRPIPDRIVWRAARMASGLATARPSGLDVRG